jgi:hypothetical protein
MCPKALCIMLLCLDFDQWSEMYSKPSHVFLHHRNGVAHLVFVQVREDCPQRTWLLVLPLPECIFPLRPVTLRFALMRLLSPVQNSTILSMSPAASATKENYLTFMSVRGKAPPRSRYFFLEPGKDRAEVYKVCAGLLSFCRTTSISSISESERPFVDTVLSLPPSKPTMSRNMRAAALSLKTQNPSMSTIQTQLFIQRPQSAPKYVHACFVPFKGAMTPNHVCWSIKILPPATSRHRTIPICTTNPLFSLRPSSKNRSGTCHV